MLIFPIRHHSPTAARQLERLIRESRPRAILVEGPSDASELIPLLLDADTAPPVALYAYRPGGEVRASFYPFCAYSPEYVALKAGQDVGAELRFCDVPAAVMLSRFPGDSTDVDSRVDAPSAETGEYGRFAAALAEAADLDSFEEFWEAALEQEVGRQPPAGYVEVLTDFGVKAKELIVPTGESLDNLRERQMAATARAVIAGGIPDDAVLLVCGAAHAAAIAEALRADAPSPELPSFEPSEIALIPFSFPRLSEQAGYGAGNRAPWYYQQVWNLDGDYAAATRHALIMVGHHLRRLGHAPSLALAIDAYNLAMTLASMRRKDAPGVDEVVDAAVACYAQGQPGFVSAALREVLIGDAIGRITHRVGRTPLQAEFYATAQRLGLAVLDSPRQVLLHMTVPGEAEQSIFLHRLAVADVPFAREIESGLGGRNRAAQGGPLEQLARVREKWEHQWTPSTDAQLIERTAWGSTLVEVCARVLGRRLAEAQRIDAGTAVLLEMALCDVTQSFSEAMDRCETLAADSGSFPALARATYHLDGLLVYGSARRLPSDRLADLAARLFNRAVLHLPSAAICGDDAAAEVEQTLMALYELVRRQSSASIDPAAFWAAVDTVAEMAGSHSSLRGLALVLLELGGRLARDDLARRLAYWLSLATNANDNARLLAGLFSMHRGTLVRNRALIGAVTDFLLELDLDQLVPLLPVLRRSLGNLSSAERAYLEETLVAVLGIDDADAARTLRLTSEEEAWLREADATVAAVLVEWRELYGIE